MGASHPCDVFKFARNLVKSQPCYKRFGHSIVLDFFLVTIVGPMVKTPPPSGMCLRTSLGGGRGAKFVEYVRNSRAFAEYMCVQSIYQRGGESSKTVLHSVTFTQNLPPQYPLLDCLITE